MDSFCALPFVHSCTNVGGRNKPCCRFKDQKYNDQISPNDYFNGDKLKTLRKKMLDGEYISGCEKCYRDEKLKGESMRTFANTRWKGKYTTAKPKVKYMEIGLSNLCNFSCVTCDAAYSTQWWKDIDSVNAIGVNKAKGEDQVIYTAPPTDDMLENLEQVKLLGGEPFMEKRNLELLQRIDMSKVHLLLITNGSIHPNDKWKRILEICPKLYISISVDGIADSAEWNRYGTSWSKVQENLPYFKNLIASKPDSYLNIHTVIHTMNIMDIDDIINWYGENIDIKGRHDFDFLQFTKCLDVSILPENAKDYIIENTNSNMIKTFLKNNMQNFNKEQCKVLLDYANLLTKARKNAKMTDKTKKLLEIVSEATD